MAVKSKMGKTHKKIHARELVKHRLLEWVEKKNWNAERLGKESGVSASTCRNYLNPEDSTDPGLQTLEMLAISLGRTLPELLARDEQEGEQDSMQNEKRRLGVHIDWTLTTDEVVDMIRHGNPEMVRALFPQGLPGATSVPVASTVVSPHKNSAGNE